MPNSHAAAAADSAADVVASGSLADGAAGAAWLCLADGCYALVVGGGKADSEIGFEFVDEVGGHFQALGAPYAEVGAPHVARRRRGTRMVRAEVSENPIRNEALENEQQVSASVMLYHLLVSLCRDAAGHAANIAATGRALPCHSSDAVCALVLRRGVCSAAAACAAGRAASAWDGPGTCADSRS